MTCVRAGRWIIHRSFARPEFDVRCIQPKMTKWRSRRVRCAFDPEVRSIIRPDFYPTGRVRNGRPLAEVRSEA